MKIGILTFHDGINFGAFMQTYCLFRFLSSLGHEVKIIDYKSNRHKRKEYKSILATKRPGLFIKNLIKIRKFRKLQKSKFELTKSCRKIEEINTIDLDLIVCGSDEIWNYENPLIGFDPAYFSIGLNTAAISYAASFGSISKEVVLPSEVRAGLEKIGKISVRDTNSFSIVDRNLEIQPEIVLDPTFLFDMTDKAVPVRDKDYILFYSIILEQHIVEQVTDFAKKVSKKIIAVGYPASWADKNYISIDPFLWLGYIKEADFIFTSMFHGTIYSILLNKQFALITTEYRKNKLYPMLNDLGLENRIIKNNNDITGQLQKVFNNKIDYNAVNGKIHTSKTKSVQYLENAIKEFES